MSAETCCNGTCRRKASPPPMVMRSDLTGTWWVVMRYKDLGEGRFEALEKHRLADDSAQQLEAMRSRPSAQDALDELDDLIAESGPPVVASPESVEHP